MPAGRPKRAETHVGWAGVVGSRGLGVAVLPLVIKDARSAHATLRHEARAFVQDADLVRLWARVTALEPAALLYKVQPSFP